MSITRGPSRGKPGRRREVSPKVAKTASFAENPTDKTMQYVQTNRVVLAAGAAILAAGLWSYGATFWELIQVWSREPDYSHGFIVAPLAAYFLWLRRGTFPGLKASNPYLGLPLFAVSLTLRYFAAQYFLEFLETWSIMFWLASVVSILGGGRLLLWCLPSIGFLSFMIPLPFSLEGAFSSPLQRLATKISCWSLQLFGQPAFADGNVIYVGKNILEVAQACSGLRLFMSVVALAYAYLVIVRRAWWEKAILVLAVVPIAIVSNSARIVATGLIYQFTDSESLRKLAHDFAGWGMILLATALFWLVLKYLKWLIREEEIMEVADLMRHQRVPVPK